MTSSVSAAKTGAEGLGALAGWNPQRPRWRRRAWFRGGIRVHHFLNVIDKIRGFDGDDAGGDESECEADGGHVGTTVGTRT